MEKLKALIKSKLSRELIMYLVFGVLTTIVSIAAFWLFNDLLAVHYSVANIISWLLAVTFAFFTNKAYVFQSKTATKAAFFKEMLMFYAARLFSLGVEELGLFMMIDMLSVPEMASKLVLQVVVVVLNYILSKLVVFRKK